MNSFTFSVRDYMEVAQTMITNAGKVARANFEALQNMTNAYLQACNSCVEACHSCCKATEEAYATTTSTSPGNPGKNR